ncbi:MAG: hypothetical protein LAT81_09910 [Oceanicaulis sp.]|nr:hypothetical protein [Oceanicaulis sp.]
MKVEVELEEIEKLKTEIRIAQKRSSELEKQIKKLESESSKRSAIELSIELFHRHMDAAFEQLGVEKYEDWNPYSHHLLRRLVEVDLEKIIHGEEKLEVSYEIGLMISNKIIKGFSRIISESDLKKS